MELRQLQQRFTRNIAHLINFAVDNGFELTFGEAWRSEETQTAHVKAGRSNTLNSMHLKRLAIDFNIFKYDYLLFSDSSRKEQDFSEAKKLGDYWIELHLSNRWGGNFQSIFDPNHFEMYIP